jgi:hypothetical protein
MVICYLIVIAMLLVAGTIFISMLIVRTEFQWSKLRFVLFGMIVSVVLSIMLVVFVTVDAPQLFVTQDVNRTMFIVGITCMSIGTIFTAIGVRVGAVRQIQVNEV